MPRFPIPALWLAFALSMSFGAAHAATFTVTSTADSGAGTLREAINKANVVAAADTIKFDIPGAGPHTITLGSALPTVTAPVTIDGYSQGGSSANTLTEGTDAVLTIVVTHPAGNILRLSTGSSGSTVRGIGFSTATAAVSVDNSGNHLIAGNFFANCEDAILLFAAAFDVTVGGTARADCNLIRSSDSGILINGADGTVIQGNLIGTNAAGTASAGNIDGIRLIGATNTLIGGIATDAGNVISGNTNGIFDTATGDFDGNNRIEGNRIGTNAAGTAALGNTDGIVITDISSETVGGVDPAAGNLISGNAGAGVIVNGATERTASIGIRNNFIGTDLTGSAAIPNAGNGVRITGSLAADTLVHENIISGNAGNGLRVQNNAADTLITGNRIGTDATGLSALPNTLSGVSLNNDDGTTLGGNTQIDRNLISGNGEHGVVLEAGTGNVLGNLIGTDITGLEPLPNQLNGISVTANRLGFLGSGSGGRNVISGNAGHGISVASAAGVGLAIRNNAIGTGPQGELDVGNGGSGIHISDTVPAGLVIGGDLGGQRNFIAFNAGDGITVTGATSAGIRWFGNLIFGNGGIGIDLADDGPTSNDGAGDADSGPNGLQNFPTLATLEAGNDATLTYTLATTASSTFTVEFFANTSKGRMRFLARETGVVTDGAGNLPSTPVALGPVGLAETVVAVLINEATGNCSELSAPPLEPTDATVFDPGLYMKKGKFTINFSKHEKGQTADSLSFSGNINPAGIEDLFSGVQITLVVNGQDLLDDALDPSGKNSNLPLAIGTYTFSIKPSNGAYSFKAKGMDLREILDVADADVLGSVEVMFGLRFTGSTLTTSEFLNIFEFELISAQRKSASGKFAFKNDITSSGAFLSLKSSATEKAAGPLHTVKLSGVVSAGALDLTPAGNVDLNIGTSGTITLTPADYTIKDTGPQSIVTMNKEAVPEIAKFQINNAKHTFSLTTNEIDAGLDAAGAGATANTMPVVFVWDTTSGDTITFTQQIELKRSDIESGTWKR